MVTQISAALHPSSGPKAVKDISAPRGASGVSSLSHPASVSSLIKAQRVLNKKHLENVQGLDRAAKKTANSGKQTAGNGPSADQGGSEERSTLNLPPNSPPKTEPRSQEAPKWGTKADLKGSQGQRLMGDPQVAEKGDTLCWGETVDTRGDCRLFQNLGRRLCAGSRAEMVREGRRAVLPGCRRPRTGWRASAAPSAAWGPAGWGDSPSPHTPSCTRRWLRASTLQWGSSANRASSATGSLSLSSASPKGITVLGSTEFCCCDKQLSSPRGLEQRLISCSNPMPLVGHMRALQEVLLIPRLRLGSSKAVLKIKLCRAGSLPGR